MKASKRSITPRNITSFIQLLEDKPSNMKYVFCKILTESMKGGT